MSGSRGMETVNHYLESGVPSIAVAALMIRCAHILCRHGDDKAIGGMLQSMWNVVGEHLLEELPGHGNDELGVAVAFIDRYFSARGDWQKMERVLVDRIGLKWPGRAAQVSKLLADMQQMTEKNLKELKP